MAGIRDMVVAAIHTRKVVHLRYAGDASARVVCPHVLCRTSTGEEFIDAYQLSGPTQGGVLPDWRSFHLDEIVSLTTVAKRFAAATGYNPASERFRHGIIARI